MFWASRVFPPVLSITINLRVVVIRKLTQIYDFLKIYFNDFDQALASKDPNITQKMPVPELTVKTTKHSVLEIRKICNSSKFDDRL